jgi:hypothetical protein
MGAYNKLHTELRCPRCGKPGPVEIEFKFGLLKLRDYQMGDTVEWGDKALRHPTTPPPGGHFSGEGYVECLVCGKDYWVVIDVEADIIRSVEPDPTRPGYIA